MVLGAVYRERSCTRIAGYGVACRVRACNPRPLMSQDRYEARDPETRDFWPDGGILCVSEAPNGGICVQGL